MHDFDVELVDERGGQLTADEHPEPDGPSGEPPGDAIAELTSGAAHEQHRPSLALHGDDRQPANPAIINPPALRHDTASQLDARVAASCVEAAETRQDVAAGRHARVVLDHLPARRRSTTLPESVEPPVPATGTNHKELPISATKLLAATALALVTLGTPLAHAAGDFPPGPTANAGSAFPPGPSATIVAAYPPGPSIAAAYPPGPTKSIIAI